ncbi:MAG: hypothetical protein EZS28_014870 [Streblomastix strix]|uniref:Uncharacterized protein n=1 Tax=Streblomastix strix TaxID=222440 RepID=A0A5J4W3V4_9EUKA|nr:MAG: hypothetical protein EZS28_014870 [Streblomastix strix]
MPQNSIKPEPSEPGLFVNFDPPKFVAKAPVATAFEQPEMGVEIVKFLQAELQPTLQDIERQLTPRQAVSGRTQTLMAKVLEAMTGVQANEIDFCATNILDERNGEARRREIQCPSLLPVTSLPVPDEELDAKLSPIDKILQSEQALALHNFRIGEGMLAHFETGSHMLGAQIIARSDTANKDAIGITNLLFGIQQLGKARVKTKRFRQLTPSAIWKQVMRPMLNQNENQALAQNQEIQIRRIHDDMPPPNSGPREQPPPDQGLYTQRNTAIPQSAILPPALNAEQEIPGIPNILTKETIKEHMRSWMLKGFDLIPVGKDDDGQYWPGFGPEVPHATDWRKAKQQGQTPSMNEFRAFWREHNFELRVACVRREYDSEDDSETLQPAKTTRQEFRKRSGSRGYSRSRDYEGPRETRTDADKNYNGFETRNESSGRSRGTYRGRGYSYQGRGRSYQDRDQSNQDRYREAQKYNPYTNQAFNTNNPINCNKTHQFEDENRGESWDDNPNDDWAKRIQMQKDAPDNHCDRYSTWTEDVAPQHQVSTPQSKLPTQQTQRVKQIQVQSKQQTSAQTPKQKGRIGQPPNQDDIDEQEIVQERLAALQKQKEDLGISDSDMEWQQLIGATDSNNNLTPRSAQKQLQEMIQQSISNQTTKQQQQTIGSKIQQRIISPAPRMINTGMNKDKPVVQSQLSVTPTQKSQHRSGLRQRLKKVERELELLKAKQQLQQQENNDLNNTNVEVPDNQGPVGQLTGSQPSPIAESPGLNAGVRPMEGGSISASNRERTEPQINEGHDNNADEQEDEQTDEAALNQNKDCRVTINSQPPVQENLGTQPKKKQRLECFVLNGKR